MWSDSISAVSRCRVDSRFLGESPIRDRNALHRMLVSLGPKRSTFHPAPRKPLRVNQKSIVEGYRRFRSNPFRFFLRNGRSIRWDRANPSTIPRVRGSWKNISSLEVKLSGRKKECVLERFYRSSPAFYFPSLTRLFF